MIYDATYDVVVYPPDQAFRAASVGEAPVWLSDKSVAVKATTKSLQLLRSIGLPIPQPMRAYDWPGRFTPFEAQRTTANFLVATPRAFVLSDMGTGKTLAALWAADYLMEQHGRGFRAIIVTTLSTMSSVWADAIFKTFFRGRSFVLVSGTAEKRRQLLSREADFYIINHDGLTIGAPSERGKPLTGLAADLAARDDIKLAIVDEASIYRSHTTRRHRVARALLSPRPYLWLMTGTPTPNGPTDAYGLAKLVNNANGESFRSYEDRVTFPIGPFKRVPRAGGAEQAKQMMQPAVRFAIEDCIDLPPCTVSARDVELSKEQAAAYADLKRDATLQIKSAKVTAVNEAVLRMKLIQVACGCIYDGDKHSHEIDASPRLAELQDIVEQCPHKVIVFAPLTNVLHLLYKQLQGFERAMIYGSVPQKERAEIFRRFQDPKDKLRVIVADPGTMAHGLTLTEASTIIWYAPTDRTETYLQANKRIDRPGQKNHTSIIQMAATAIEKEIYRRLEANETMQGVILKLAEDK